MAIELLAPAGNTDIARSAILSGADAIYIGPPSFGARQSAGNSMEEIARLLDFAHLFGVRVYLTMNTILYDDEIEKAYSIARRAEEIGVDALIIQDMAYLKMGLKRIPFHASTQTFNFDLEKIRLVSMSGFDRLVLERSLTLDEIRKIRATVPQELECFIHGAMCVGYSGRCYLSEFLCGRSGNRGVCSQACRSQYDLYDEAGKLLKKSSSVLSVSDIDFSGHITDLINAGVSSFKIEGRLKDESYVINNVSFYNNILNSLQAERTSRGVINCGFTPDPRKSFSRGQSGCMFLENPRARVGAPTKSMGEIVGTIDRIDGNVVKIRMSSQIMLHNGDGVCWIHDSKQYGAYINGVYGREILLSSSEELSIGDTLYRNFDKEFHPTSRDVSRKLSVRIRITADRKNIHVSTGDFSRDFEYVFSRANNPELAIRNIKSSFSKVGELPFDVVSVETEFEEVPFLQSSFVNSMRRNFLSSFMDELIHNYRVPIRQFEISTGLRFLEVLSYEWNVSNRYSSDFYMEHGASVIEPAPELQDDLTGKVVMRSRYCIRRQYGLCPKENPSVRSASPLILDNNGKRLKALFDCRSCQMSLSAL